MDLLTPQENQNWTALLAAVVAAFLVATGIAFVLDRETGADDGLLTKKDRRVNPRVQPDDPEIVQAPWKMVAFPSIEPGKPTSKQKRAVRRAASGVKHTVQDLYDALTVSRANFDEVSRMLMPKAARNALRGRTLVPFTLERVKTTQREARIAIDRSRRTSASAKVALAFKADRGDKRIAFHHRGTLWLERGQKRWRVIGFDLDQKKRA